MDIRHWCPAGIRCVFSVERNAHQHFGLDSFVCLSVFGNVEFLEGQNAGQSPHNYGREEFRRVNRRQGKSNRLDVREHSLHCKEYGACKCMEGCPTEECFPIHPVRHTAYGGDGSYFFCGSITLFSGGSTPSKRISVGFP